MYNFQALAKVGIGSAYSVITNGRIDELQGHTTKLINKVATYQNAMTEMAHAINTLQSNKSNATPLAAAS